MRPNLSAGLSPHSEEILKKEAPGLMQDLTAKALREGGAVVDKDTREFVQTRQELIGILDLFRSNKKNHR